MADEANASCSKQTSNVTSLVHFCQRVLCANIGDIVSLDGVPLRLISPVLQGCDATTLNRLERGSLVNRLFQNLHEKTSDLWRDICFKRFPLDSSKLADSDEVEFDIEFWKKSYFHLKEAEDERLKEATSRIRLQRSEAEENKRKRQVVLTDRQPSSKRMRSSPAKTLFEKTRKDASRFQRSVFGSRASPPVMRNARLPEVCSSKPVLPQRTPEPAAVPVVTTLVTKRNGLPKKSLAKHAHT